MLDGGIGRIEMLHRSNIMALVGGGKLPKFDKGKVIIWDDQEKQVYNEIAFNSDVLNVKLKKDLVMVSIESEINVYSFPDIDFKKKYETSKNDKGIMVVNGSEARNVLAFPGKTKGSVTVVNFENETEFIIDNAHETEIGQIGINYDGTLIATCSEKGTLIRIFGTDKLEKPFAELRRGAEKAEIYSLAFSPDNKFLCCASDRGTVHVFALGFDDKVQAKNKKSMLNFIPLTYFKSEWSFAQLKLNESKAICAFGKDDSILVLTDENKYYQAVFDLEKGGDCTVKDAQTISY